MSSTKEAVSKPSSTPNHRRKTSAEWLVDKSDELSNPAQQIVQRQLNYFFGKCVYSVKRFLGRGSYGSVFEAIDTRTQCRVAVKQVNRIFSNLTDTKRLLREVTILRSLQHDNIIELCDLIPASSDVLNDSDVDDDETNTIKSFDVLLLVFEFIDTDLSKVIRSPQFLSEMHIK